MDVLALHQLLSPLHYQFDDGLLPLLSNYRHFDDEDNIRKYL